MEETELEEWFVREKEKLEERFSTVLRTEKDDKKINRAKEHFDSKYRALIHKYQNKQNSMYTQQRRAAAMQAPIARIREHTQTFFKRIKDWKEQKKQAVKKWRFDRKVRRILKDKSDL